MRSDSAIALATLAGVVLLVLVAIALAGANPAGVASQIIGRALGAANDLNGHAIIRTPAIQNRLLGIKVAYAAEKDVQRNILCQGGAASDDSDDQHKHQAQQPE